MARRAPVNSRAATINVLRHIGRYLHRPQIFDEVPCVIDLVSTQRDRLCTATTGFAHAQRRNSFCSLDGLRQVGIYETVLAIFHQPIPTSAEPRRFLVTLTTNFSQTS